MLGFVRSFFSSAVPTPSASAVSAVDKLIAESPVAVFSKSYCPYCRSAKETLAGQFKPAQIKVMELDLIENGSDVQDAIAAKLGASRVTVPQIFIQQKPIGGNSDLNALMNNDVDRWSALVKSVTSDAKL